MAAKLKAAIIGTGGISVVHQRGYAKSERADLYAICDIKPDVLKAKGDEWKIPEDRRFIDYRDLLRLKEVDCVSVCTPNLLHCEMTVNALRAGKHVLCEKPMAMSGAESQKMNDAARKSGKKLQIGLMNRFRNDANYIRRLRESGELGDVYYARCQAIRRRGVPSWGVFGQLDQQGGGGVIDIGVHMMDLTWWLMGCPQPVAISGQTYRTIGNEPGHAGTFGPWDWKTYTVEDFAVGLVRFKNGATMSIESGFIANTDKPREACHIVGDKGGAGIEPLTVQLEREGHLLDCTPNDIEGIDINGRRGYTIHEREVFSFCKAIVENKPVWVPGTQIIWVQKMINGLYQSAKLGREIAIK